MRLEEFLGLLSIYMVGSRIGPDLIRPPIGLGAPADNGDGEVENVPTPASPDGACFYPLTSPWGTNIPHFHPLMDEIPVGDRGSGPRCHID